MRLDARRLAAPALAALILLAGCSDDGGDDEADAATTTEAEAETTTTADEGATTTVAGEGDEGGEDGTTTTEGDEGGATTVPGPAPEGQEGIGAPDEEAADVSWALNAAQYRDQDGRRIAFLCPPDGEIGSVWGTDTYTDDSSVCSAAVHAGIINPIEGGRVVIEISEGEESYDGTEANGVTSQDYGSWSGSFTFPIG